MSDLPEGWVKTTLGDIAEVQSGAGFPIRFQGNAEGDYPFAKVSDISKAVLERNGILESASNYVSEETRENLGAKVIPKGSTVFAKIGAALLLNRRAICGVDLLLDNNATGVWSIIKDIDRNWLFGFLRQFDITSLAAGNAIPSVRKSDLCMVDVDLPPKEEQKRIVAKLESCESRITAAREALDEVPALLEQYRQSILAAAFRGDLTKDWRASNLDVKSTAALLDGLRKQRRERWEKAELEKYEDKGKEPPKNWVNRYKEPKRITDEQKLKLPILPSSWEWATIEEITEDGNVFDGPFGSKLKTKDYTESGIRVIRLENIAPQKFIEEKESYVSNDKLEDLQRHEVFEGDIIFSSFIFSPLRVCRLPKLETKAIAKADCLTIRATFKEVGSDYINYALSSPLTGAAIVDDVHGATRPRINTGQLRGIPIPIGPQVEQIEIERRLSKAIDLIKRVESEHLSTQREIGELNETLLAKAFRGELTHQDPDDEPASELLCRIKEARENAPKPQKKKPAKKRSNRMKPKPNELPAQILKLLGTKAKSFQDLRDGYPDTPYQLLQETLFEMASSQGKPSIKMTFNEKKEQMEFKKLSS